MGHLLIAMVIKEPFKSATMAMLRSDLVFMSLAHLIFQFERAFATACYRAQAARSTSAFRQAVKATKAAVSV